MTNIYLKHALEGTCRKVRFADIGELKGVLECALADSCCSVSAFLKLAEQFSADDDGESHPCKRKKNTNGQGSDGHGGLWGAQTGA
jgi:hypothetical protein